MTSSKLTEYPYYNTNFVIQKTKCEHFQTICCRVKSVGGGCGGGGVLLHQWGISINVLVIGKKDCPKKSKAE